MESSAHPEADICRDNVAGVPVGADGTGGAAESIVNQTAVDLLRRLPVSFRRGVARPESNLLSPTLTWALPDRDPGLMPTLW